MNVHTSSPPDLSKNHNHTPIQTQTVKKNECDSGSDGSHINGATFFSWPNKDLATVGAHMQVLHAILNNFGGTIGTLRGIGFAEAKCDLKEQMPPLTSRTGLVDINISSLDDELTGRKGSDFIMIL